MRRRGFLTAIVSVIAVLTILITAVLADQLARSADIDERSMAVAKSAIAARRGLKIAEDWLMRTLMAGTHHVGRVILDAGSDAPGHAGPGPDDPLWAPTGELHIVDADCVPDSYSLKYAVPWIVPESVDGGVRRYFFLRSCVGVEGGNLRMAEEELIAVLIDGTGRITESARLFHRSRSERK
jgi:hypothetical protein